jgi:hypothetical protein
MFFPFHVWLNYSISLVFQVSEKVPQNKRIKKKTPETSKEKQERNNGVYIANKMKQHPKWRFAVRKGEAEGWLVHWMRTGLCMTLTVQFSSTPTLPFCRFVSSVQLSSPLYNVSRITHPLKAEKMAPYTLGFLKVVLGKTWFSENQVTLLLLLLLLLLWTVSLLLLSLLLLILLLGACDGAVGWGTALQAGRSRVRFPTVSLEFFNDIILPATLWPWGWLSL